MLQVDPANLPNFFFGKRVGRVKMYDFFLEPPLCSKLRSWYTHALTREKLDSR